MSSPTSVKRSIAIALPAASDLKTAFEKASAEIAARERAEGKEASNPQAHFGRALVEHLRSDFPAVDRWLTRSGSAHAMHFGSIDLVAASAENG